MTRFVLTCQYPIQSVFVRDLATGQPYTIQQNVTTVINSSANILVEGMNAPGLDFYSLYVSTNTNGWYAYDDPYINPSYAQRSVTFVYSHRDPSGPNPEDQTHFLIYCGDDVGSVSFDYDGHYSGTVYAGDVFDFYSYYDVLITSVTDLDGNYVSLDYCTAYDSSYSYNRWNLGSDPYINVAPGCSRSIKIDNLKPKYTYYFQTANGVFSYSVQKNGVWVFNVASGESFDLPNMTTDDIATVYNITLNNGYVKPYLYSVGGSSGSFSSDSCNFGGYTENTVIAIGGTVKAMDLFDWGVSITKGQVITAITQSRWYNFLMKIRELYAAYGTDFNIAPYQVISGQDMTAILFNDIRTVLSGLPGYGYLSGPVVAGHAVFATYFDGYGSIKNSLNEAIQYYLDN